MGYVHTYSTDTGKDAVRNVYNASEESMQNLYSEAVRALGEADIIVLELSVHSFTQGYLVKKALDQGKPVIGLHHDTTHVAFALGIEDENFQTYSYNLENSKQVLKDALSFALEKTDIRFNMMLSSKLNTYLKWAARDLKVTRASFVRNLLQQHLETNQRYIEK